MLYERGHRLEIRAMFKTKPHHLLLGAAGLALAACATSTPYAPADSGGGYGFNEQKIEDDRYRITFRGNSLTQREQVETYLLLRAAELTLAEGYDHFIVVEDDTEKTTTYTGVASPALGGFGYGFGPYGFYGARAFPYYGFGPGFGPGFGGGLGGDINIRARDRYSAVAYIVLGRGEKPDDVMTAYDASEVVRNLRPLVEQAEG